jgi:hypothetical protein
VTSADPLGARPVRSVAPINTSGVPVQEATTAAEFARCLEQVRVLAGPLSNREIETKSGHTLRRTKIGQVLRGDLPRRDFLVTYLRVCGVAEREVPTWIEVWSRLAHVELPTTVATRRNARERASAVIATAEARAREITAQAQAEVDRLMAFARVEADRVRQVEESRIAAAEEERDSAMARARVLTSELDGMHETSLERIRTADFERDAALTRAHDLAVRLNEMHENSENRVRDAEDARDMALARAKDLAEKLDSAQARIDELREQIGRMADRKVRAAKTAEPNPDTGLRYSPAYLVDDSGVFNDSRKTTRPVIGDQD